MIRISLLAISELIQEVKKDCINVFDTLYSNGFTFELNKEQKRSSSFAPTFILFLFLASTRSFSGEATNAHAKKERLLTYLIAFLKRCLKLLSCLLVELCAKCNCITILMLITTATPILKTTCSFVFQKSLARKHNYSEASSVTHLLYA